MAHLTMHVIFHMNVINCENFNLPHINHIWKNSKKNFNEKFQIGDIVSKHGSNYVKWYGSTCFQLS